MRARAAALGLALDEVRRALGLDAIFPTFFLALVILELREPRSRPIALAGALIALALVPFTPPGVPVLAAAAATLLALRPARGTGEAA